MERLLSQDRLTLASLDLAQVLSCRMVGVCHLHQHSPPNPAHLSLQMKFSLEKLHQGITVSDPPFDSQPQPDDSFS